MRQGCNVRALSGVVVSLPAPFQEAAKTALPVKSHSSTGLKTKNKTSSLLRDVHSMVTLRCRQELCQPAGSHPLSPRASISVPSGAAGRGHGGFSSRLLLSEASVLCQPQAQPSVRGRTKHCWPIGGENNTVPYDSCRGLFQGC